MSQDKFWEQLTGGPGNTETPAGSGAGAGTAQPAADNPGGVDADVLAAWLRALPSDDTLLAPTAPASQATPSAPVENAPWPPSAPQDPFAGMTTKTSGPPASADWDLSFTQPTIVPTSTPTAPPPPAPPATPSPAAPPPPPPVSDFLLDAPGAGAAPVAEAPPTIPAPPVASPFGPAPPPAAPPEEALQAPPLRVLVTSGRRTVEQSLHGEALIGRPDATRRIHPEIDLRLDDAVSRRHAKIFVQDGRYVVTDLNSTNGTRHNQRWLSPEAVVPLAAGDEIEVGEISLIKIIEVPDPNA